MIETIVCGYALVGIRLWHVLWWAPIRRASQRRFSFGLIGEYIVGATLCALLWPLVMPIEHVASMLFWETQAHVARARLFVARWLAGRER